MGYDHRVAKSRVNMTLNEDLVRRAREFTPNLSETVEGLLARFVETEEAKLAVRERQIDEHIAASNAFIARYGTLADEYTTL
jgi:antitoxin CcdA